jgi:hypothetical protein
MKNVSEIVNELGAISPLLAGIPRGEAPYTLPAGYFETFADQLMIRIKTIQDPGAIEELKSLSPLLGRLDKKFFFDVPAQYFEGFPADMMARLRALGADSVGEELEMLSPLLSGLDKKTPFSLPFGYFKELSGNLVAGMQAVEFVRDELEDTSALLVGLKEKKPYTVPDGYFESLSETILQRVKQNRRPSKVISISKSKSWLKYAAAAAITGLILTTGILYFDRTRPTVEDPAAGLVKVSDQEIVNYMENEDIPLAGTSIFNNNNSVVASLDEFNDTDIKDLMSDVSDNELVQYASDQLNSKDLQTN